LLLDSAERLLMSKRVAFHFEFEAAFLSHSLSGETAK